MGDMSYEQNAVEIISYNFNDPSLILNGKFTCKVAFTNCYSSCGIPIRFNLTILEGPNNDWHYYSGVVADTSTEVLVSTFIVDSEATFATTTRTSTAITSTTSYMTTISPPIADLTRNSICISQLGTCSTYFTPECICVGSTLLVPYFILSWAVILNIFLQHFLFMIYIFS